MVRDLIKSQERQISDNVFETILEDVSVVNITFDKFLLT